MKALIHLTLTLLLAGVSSATTAASSGVGVLDLGRDGDIRYYEIRCKDGRTVILEGDYEKKQACFPLNSGEQSCLKTLDIRSAGERACMATAQ